MIVLYFIYVLYGALCISGAFKEIESSVEQLIYKFSIPTYETLLREFLELQTYTYDPSAGYMPYFQRYQSSSLSPLVPSSYASKLLRDTVTYCNKYVAKYGIKEEQLRGAKGTNDLDVPLDSSFNPYSAFRDSGTHLIRALVEQGGEKLSGFRHNLSVVANAIERGYLLDSPYLEDDDKLQRIVKVTADLYEKQQALANEGKESDLEGKQSMDFTSFFKFIDYAELKQMVVKENKRVSYFFSNNISKLPVIDAACCKIHEIPRVESMLVGGSLSSNFLDLPMTSKLTTNILHPQDHLLYFNAHAELIEAAKEPLENMLPTIVVYSTQNVYTGYGSPLKRARDMRVMRRAIFNTYESGEFDDLKSLMNPFGSKNSHNLLNGFFFSGVSITRHHETGLDSRGETIITGIVDDQYQSSLNPLDSAQPNIIVFVIDASASMEENKYRLLNIVDFTANSILTKIDFVGVVLTNGNGTTVHPCFGSALVRYTRNNIDSILRFIESVPFCGVEAIDRGIEAAYNQLLFLFTMTGKNAEFNPEDGAPESGYAGGYPITGLARQIYFFICTTGVGVNNTSSRIVNVTNEINVKYFILLLSQEETYKRTMIALGKTDLFSKFFVVKNPYMFEDYSLRLACMSRGVVIPYPKFQQIYDTTHVIFEIMSAFDEANFVGGVSGRGTPKVSFYTMKSVFYKSIRLSIPVRDFAYVKDSAKRMIDKDDVLLEDIIKNTISYDRDPNGLYVEPRKYPVIRGTLSFDIDLTNTSNSVMNLGYNDYIFALFSNGYYMFHPHIDVHHSITEDSFYLNNYEDLPTGLTPLNFIFGHDKTVEKEKYPQYFTEDQLTSKTLFHVKDLLTLNEIPMGNIDVEVMITRKAIPFDRDATDDLLKGIITDTNEDHSVEKIFTKRILTHQLKVHLGNPSWVTSSHIPSVILYQKRRFDEVAGGLSGGVSDSNGATETNSSNEIDDQIIYGAVLSEYGTLKTTMIPPNKLCTDEELKMLTTGDISFISQDESAYPQISTILSFDKLYPDAIPVSWWLGFDVSVGGLKSEAVSPLVQVLNSNNTYKRNQSTACFVTRKQATNGKVEGPHILNKTYSTPYTVFPLYEMLPSLFNLYTGTDYTEDEQMKYTYDKIVKEFDKYFDTGQYNDLLDFIFTRSTQGATEYYFYKQNRYQTEDGRPEDLLSNFALYSTRSQQIEGSKLFESFELSVKEFFLCPNFRKRVWFKYEDLADLITPDEDNDNTADGYYSPILNKHIISVLPFVSISGSIYKLLEMMFHGILNSGTVEPIFKNTLQITFTQFGNFLASPLISTTLNGLYNSVEHSSQILKMNPSIDTIVPTSPISRMTEYFERSGYENGPDAEKINNTVLTELLMIQGSVIDLNSYPALSVMYSPLPYLSDPDNNSYILNRPGFFRLPFSKPYASIDPGIIYLLAQNDSYPLTISAPRLFLNLPDGMGVEDLTPEDVGGKWFVKYFTINTIVDNKKQRLDRMKTRNGILSCDIEIKNKEQSILGFMEGNGLINENSEFYKGLHDEFFSGDTTTKNVLLLVDPNFNVISYDGPEKYNPHFLFIENNRAAIKRVIDAMKESGGNPDFNFSSIQNIINGVDSDIAYKDRYSLRFSDEGVNLGDIFPGFLYSLLNSNIALEIITKVNERISAFSYIVNRDLDNVLDETKDENLKLIKGIDNTNIFTSTLSNTCYSTGSYYFMKIKETNLSLLYFKDFNRYSKRRRSEGNTETKMGETGCTDIRPRFVVTKYIDKTKVAIEFINTAQLNQPDEYGSMPPLNIGIQSYEVKKLLAEGKSKTNQCGTPFDYWGYNFVYNTVKRSVKQTTQGYYKFLMENIAGYSCRYQMQSQIIMIAYMFVFEAVIVIIVGIVLKRIRIKSEREEMGLAKTLKSPFKLFHYIDSPSSVYNRNLQNGRIIDHVLSNAGISHFSVNNGAKRTTKTTHILSSDIITRAMNNMLKSFDIINLYCEKTSLGAPSDGCDSGTSSVHINNIGSPFDDVNGGVFSNYESDAYASNSENVTSQDDSNIEYGETLAPCRPVRRPKKNGLAFMAKYISGVEKRENLGVLDMNGKDFTKNAKNLKFPVTRMNKICLGSETSKHMSSDSADRKNSESSQDALPSGKTTNRTDRDTEKTQKSTTTLQKSQTSHQSTPRGTPKTNTPCEKRQQIKQEELRTQNNGRAGTSGSDAEDESNSAIEIDNFSDVEVFGSLLNEEREAKGKRRDFRFEFVPSLCSPYIQHKIKLRDIQESFVDELSYMKHPFGYVMMSEGSVYYEDVKGRNEMLGLRNQRSKTHKFGLAFNSEPNQPVANERSGQKLTALSSNTPPPPTIKQQKEIHVPFEVVLLRSECGRQIHTLLARQTFEGERRMRQIILPGDTKPKRTRELRSFHSSNAIKRMMTNRLPLRLIPLVSEVFYGSDTMRYFNSMKLIKLTNNLNRLLNIRTIRVLRDMFGCAHEGPENVLQTPTWSHWVGANSNVTISDTADPNGTRHFFSVLPPEATPAAVVFNKLEIADVFRRFNQSTVAKNVTTLELVKGLNTNTLGNKSALLSYLNRRNEELFDESVSKVQGLIVTRVPDLDLMFLTVMNDNPFNANWLRSWMNNITTLGSLEQNRGASPYSGAISSLRGCSEIGSSISYPSTLRYNVVITQFDAFCGGSQERENLLPSVRGRQERITKQDTASKRCRNMLSISDDNSMTGSSSNVRGTAQFGSTTGRRVENGWRTHDSNKGRDILKNEIFRIRHITLGSNISQAELFQGADVGKSPNDRKRDRNQRWRIQDDDRRLSVMSFFLNLYPLTSYRTLHKIQVLPPSNVVFEKRAEILSSTTAKIPQGLASKRRFANNNSFSSYGEYAESLFTITRTYFDPVLGMIKERPKSATGGRKSKNKERLLIKYLLLRKLNSTNKIPEITGMRDVDPFMFSRKLREMLAESFYVKKDKTIKIRRSGRRQHQDEEESYIDFDRGLKKKEMVSYSPLSSLGNMASAFANITEMDERGTPKGKEYEDGGDREDFMSDSDNFSIVDRFEAQKGFGNGNNSQPGRTVPVTNINNGEWDDQNLFSDTNFISDNPFIKRAETRRRGRQRSRKEGADQDEANLDINGNIIDDEGERAEARRRKEFGMNVNSYFDSSNDDDKKNTRNNTGRGDTQRGNINGMIRGIDKAKGVDADKQDGKRVGTAKGDTFRGQSPETIGQNNRQDRYTGILGRNQIEDEGKMNSDTFDSFNRGDAFGSELGPTKEEGGAVERATREEVARRTPSSSIQMQSKPNNQSSLSISSHLDKPHPMASKLHNAADSASGLSLQLTGKQGSEGSTIGLLIPEQQSSIELIGNHNVSSSSTIEQLVGKTSVMRGHAAPGNITGPDPKNHMQGSQEVPSENPTAQSFSSVKSGSEINLITKKFVDNESTITTTTISLSIDEGIDTTVKRDKSTTKHMELESQLRSNLSLATSPQSTDESSISLFVKGSESETVSTIQSVHDKERPDNQTTSSTQSVIELMSKGQESHTTDISLIMEQDEPPDGSCGTDSSAVSLINEHKDEFMQNSRRPRQSIGSSSTSAPAATTTTNSNIAATAAVFAESSSSSQIGLLLPATKEETKNSYDPRMFRERTETESTPISLMQRDYCLSDSSESSIEITNGEKNKNHRMPPIRMPSLQDLTRGGVTDAAKDSAERKDPKQIKAEDSRVSSIGVLMDELNETTNAGPPGIIGTLVPSLQRVRKPLRQPGELSSISEIRFTDSLRSEDFSGLATGRTPRTFGPTGLLRGFIGIDENTTSTSGNITATTGHTADSNTNATMNVNTDSVLGQDSKYDGSNVKPDSGIKGKMHRLMATEGGETSLTVISTSPQSIAMHTDTASSSVESSDYADSAQMGSRIAISNSTEMAMPVTKEAQLDERGKFIARKLNKMTCCYRYVLRNEAADEPVVTAFKLINHSDGTNIPTVCPGATTGSEPSGSKQNTAKQEGKMINVSVTENTNINSLDDIDIGNLRREQFEGYQMMREEQLKMIKVLNRIAPLSFIRPRMLQSPSSHYFRPKVLNEMRPYNMSVLADSISRSSTMPGDNKHNFNNHRGQSSSGGVGSSVLRSFDRNRAGSPNTIWQREKTIPPNGSFSQSSSFSSSKSSSPFYSSTRHGRGSSSPRGLSRPTVRPFIHTKETLHEALADLYLGSNRSVQLETIYIEISRASLLGKQGHRPFRSMFDRINDDILAFIESEHPYGKEPHVEGRTWIDAICAQDAEEKKRIIVDLMQQILQCDAFRSLTKYEQLYLALIVFRKAFSIILLNETLNLLFKDVLQFISNEKAPSNSSSSTTVGNKNDSARGRFNVYNQLLMGIESMFDGESGPTVGGKKVKGKILRKLIESHGVSRISSGTNGRTDETKQGVGIGKPAKVIDAEKEVIDIASIPTIWEFVLNNRIPLNAVTGEILESITQYYTGVGNLLQVTESNMRGNTSNITPNPVNGSQEPPFMFQMLFDDNNDRVLAVFRILYIYSLALKGDSLGMHEMKVIPERDMRIPPKNVSILDILNTVALIKIELISNEIASGVAEFEQNEPDQLSNNVKDVIEGLVSNVIAEGL